MNRSLFLTALALTITATPALADVHIYGPGGPLPAMKAASADFEKRSGIKVVIEAGPTDRWIDQARRNADLIFSGSDTMMTGFVRKLDGRLSQSDVVPLYDRPAAILVRIGNPKGITGFRDLQRPDLKVMVVEGAGQDGLWEDIAGRSGDIALLQRTRPNIVFFAANSAEARKTWLQSPDIDAWVIWNIWQVANPGIADVVPIESDLAVRRSMAIALTSLGKKDAEARRFAEYLKTPEAAAIFVQYGWSTLRSAIDKGE